MGGRFLRSFGVCFFTGRSADGWSEERFHMKTDLSQHGSAMVFATQNDLY